MEPVKRFKAGMSVQFFLNEDDADATQGEVVKVGKKKIDVESDGETYTLDRNDIFKADESVDEPEEGEEEITEEGDGPMLKFNRIEQYERTTNEAGKKKFDNADDVAGILREMDLDDVYEYIAKCLATNGIEEIGSGKNKSGASADALRARYDGRNPGMQRMNLGNILRGAMKKEGFELLPV